MNDKPLKSSYSLAVVGAACYLPGAESLDEYWSSLYNGQISIGVPPEDRFDHNYYNVDKTKTGRTYSNLAATVDCERFCREIAPQIEKEIALSGRKIDLFPRAPGHLIALYTAMEAFRSAGISPLDRKDGRSGLFCGLVSANSSMIRKPPVPNLAHFAGEMDRAPAFASTTASERDRIKEQFLAETERQEYLSCSEKFISSDLSNDLVRLIHQVLQLEGAGFCFDAACSSSLLSIEIARNYLKSGKLKTALVGGMTWFASNSLVCFARASANSAKGSRPFDERADGLVPGEGCAFCLVKGLDEALADGDRILGVIRGVGVSSDGRGKGLWAPSERGQQFAMERAFADAGATFDELDYVEAHATSTKLGDATEMTSLEGMARTATTKKKIPVASVKANIGHILEAAGMASLQKALLCLKHETILRQPSFQEYSSKFDWENSRFYVPTQNLSWPKSPNGRLAAVEAFGIGGLNCQALVAGPETAREIAKNRRESKKSDAPIAIVGRGAVLPNAFDVPSFYATIDEDRDGTSPVPVDKKTLLFANDPKLIAEVKEKKLRGGFLNGYEYNWRLHRIPPKQVQYANPLQFIILGAADEAIASAGYRSTLLKDQAGKPLDPRKTAVVVGTRTDGDYMKAMNVIQELPLFEARLKRVLLANATPEDRADEMIADFERFLYKEYPFFEDVSGSFTISTLASRIAKTYDLMGGAIPLDGGDSASICALENAVHLLREHDDLDAVVCVAGHCSVGADVYRQYIKDGCEGPVPAEGAVAFMLKRLDDAEAAGDPICAVIRDVESGIGANETRRVVEETMRRGASNVAEMGLESTSCLCETIFDGASDDETRFVCDALRRDFAAPERKFYCDGAGSDGKTVRERFGDLRPVAGAAALLRLIGEMEKAGPNANPTGIVVQRDAAGMFGQIVVERRLSKTPVRAAESAKSSRISVVSDAAPNACAPKTNVAAEADKVVFMFPGQGSQYKGMAAKLLESNADLRALANEFDAVLTKLGFPTFGDLTVENAALLGKDVFRTQLSLLVGDSLFAKYFETRGIAPDMVLGHSFGEYPAMVAAGAWSFETAAWATERRCSIIDEVLARKNGAQASGALSATTMLSTNAPVDALQGLIDELSGRAVEENSLYISNRNAPDQTIVSGTRTALAKLEEALKARKFSAITLAVPAAYHSPLVADVCAPLREALERVEFSVPKLPILSGVSGLFEAEPDRFRDNLVEQMTRPVDFVSMIKKAYRNGGRIFVEVGTKRVLERLATKILADCPDARFLRCDDGKGGDPADFAKTESELREIAAAKRTSVVQIDGARVSGLSDKIGGGGALRGLDRVEPTSAPNRVCPVEKVEGSFYQVGWQYGQAARDEIRQALRRYADMAGTPQSKLLPELNANWDELSAKAETYFGRDGLEELRGMADGAGVPYSALLRHNLTVFPIRRQNALSMVESSGCVQLAGRASDGNFVCGGNLDVAFTRIVPDALRFSLVCRRVDNLIPSVSIVPTGLIGSRGGVNACGVAVTICDLLDEEFSSVPADGFRRGMLIQAILDRCANLDDVSRLIANSNLSGAKTLCVSDVRTGEIFHCENVGDKIVTKIGEPTVLQTNHSLLLKTPRANDAAVPEHSRVRFERLLELLNPTFASEFQRPSSEIFSVLRDAEDKSSEARAAESGRVAYRTMNMIQRRDNAYSWLFDAGKQTLEVCLTDSPYRVENETIRSDVFNVCELLPEFGDSSFRPTATSVSVSNVPSKSAAKTAPSDSLLISAEEYEKLFDNAPKPEPFDGNARVCNRYVDRLIRVVDLPKIADASGQEATLILAASTNALATQVGERIAKLGGRSVALSVFDANGELENEDVLREKVRAVLAKTPCRNVLVLSAFDLERPFEYSKNDYETLAQTIRGNMLFALQEWYRQIEADGADFENAQLLVATRMGGTLGLEGPTDPYGGAALGFVRCMKFEVCLNLNKSFRAFAVDFDSNESRDAVAEALLEELYNPAAKKEDVARLNGRRYAVRMIPDPVGCAQASTTAPPIANVDERPVWLVTGGARGVTAELALAIGKKYGAKMHLIGSSRIDGDPSWGDLDAEGLKQLRAQVMREAATAKKEKPIDVWARVEKKVEVYRNFRRFRDAGVEFEYHALDLSDYDATKALVESLLEKETRITGALFGAGFESSQLYGKKATGVFQRTIDVKLGSVVPILEVLQNAPPKFVLGMGSTSGRFGSLGQVDYCIANNALGKLLSGFAERFRDCRSVLFHWFAWDGIGMAMRPESKFVLKSAGLTYMSIVEGVDVVLTWLDAKHSDRELCVTEDKYRRWCFNSVLPTSAKPYVPTADEKSGDGKAATKVSASTENTKEFPSRFVVEPDEYLRRDSVEEYAKICDGDPNAAIDRFVVRFIETKRLPDWNDAAPWSEIVDGSVLIVGDGPAAELVVAKLRACGISVVRLNGNDDFDAVEEKIQKFWSEKPIQYVAFFNADQIDDAWKTERYWNETFRRDITFTFQICRRMVLLLRENRRFDRVGFAVSTRLGGDFGFSGQETNPFGGFISGSLKALRDEIHVKENVYLPVKAVDHGAAESAETVANDFLAEMQEELLAIRSRLNVQTALVDVDSKEAPNGDWSAFDLETGYRNGRRYTARTVLERLSADKNGANDWTNELSSNAQNEIWVAVGGLRGITNATFAALTQKVKPRKIYLVGRTPFVALDSRFLEMSEEELGNLRRDTTIKALREKKRPVAEWNKFSRQLEMNKNLAKFQRLGIDVVYIPCDTRNWAEVAAVVDRINQNGDRVSGFVFGAAWAAPDEPIERRSIQVFEDDLKTKLCGLSAFLELLCEHPLRFAVGFGSVSGRFGGNGEVSYTAQNDMVSKILAHWRNRRPECRFVCVEWGAWNDVGMAIRPETKGALLAAQPICLNTKIGSKFFVEEFANGLTEPEVLYCPWQYYQRFQPDGKSLPKNCKSSSESRNVASKARTSTTPVRGKVAVVGANADSRALTRKIATLGADVSLVEPDEADWILIATPRDAANAKTNGFDRLGALDAIVRLVAKRRCDGGEFNVLVLGNATSQNAFGYDEAEAIRKELERDANVVVARFPNDEIPAELAAAIFDGSFEIAEKPNGGAKKTTPFGENFQRAENGTKRLELVADPTTDRFLLEHHLKGGAILPFAMSLELFCELATRGENADATTNRIEIKDVKTVNGMVFAEDKPYRLVCETVRSKDGSSESMRIVGDFYNAKGVLINRARPYVTASGARTLPNVPAETVQFPNLRYAFPDLNYVSCWMTEYPEKNKLRFYHGPAFQKLRGNTFLNENESVSEILIPRRDEIVESTKPEIGNKRSVTLDAIVLDASFWACGALNGFYRRNAIVVPHSLDLLQGRLGELAEGDACRVHVRRVGEESLAMGIRQIIFDFNVIDKNNRIVYTAKGFRMTELFAPSPY